jgi:signal transduction histidine kinase
MVARPGPARYAADAVLPAVVATRWAAVVWLALFASLSGTVERPPLALGAFVGAVVWTWFLTTVDPLRPALLAVDVAWCGVLVAVSGLVLPPGHVVRGDPLAVSLSAWATAAGAGVRLGPGWGAVAGAVPGAGLLVAVPLNGSAFAGVPLLQQLHLLTLAGGPVLLGVLVGVAARQVDLAVATHVHAAHEGGRRAERVRLGGLVHDGPLQELAVLRLRGDPPGDHGYAAGVARVEEQLRGVLAPEPPPLPPGRVDLTARLRALADAARVPSATTTGGRVVLPGEEAEGVVAAVQELLLNVEKHAAATSVRVAVLVVAGTLLVSVRDDGRGLPPGAAVGSSASRGLRLSVADRVAALGGSVEIVSRPGAGTHVELRFPVDREPVPADGPVPLDRPVDEP